MPASHGQAPKFKDTVYYSEYMHAHKTAGVRDKLFARLGFFRSRSKGHTTHDSMCHSACEFTRADDEHAIRNAVGTDHEIHGVDLQNCIMMSDVMASFGIKGIGATLHEVEVMGASSSSSPPTGDGAFLGAAGLGFDGASSRFASPLAAGVPRARPRELDFKRALESQCDLEAGGDAQFDDAELEQIEMIEQYRSRLAPAPTTAPRDAEEGRAKAD
ncbi:sulfate adenylyltransferase [Aureococcus anophagefferens]|nr:sulfate adenylyltransferase [Aureococcus anophagefferens]